MNTPIAIIINFDSINENLGFPPDYRDKSYFEVFDRFLKFSDEYNFKYSIYIIGKDLENPEISARVKEWSKMGHEIGNHSYTHCLNIGGLKDTKLRYEILKSHEVIHTCTGIEPKGFICPGWATSKRVLEVLIENNYLYDTSLFPSPIMYLAIAKNAINHIVRPNKFKEIISRKDYLFPFTKPIVPFFSDKYFNETSHLNNEKIVIFPLPTLRRFSFSMWHTLFFVFSQKKVFKDISEFLDQYNYFYYLFHPADLMEKNDLGPNIKHTFERMNIDLKTKESLVRGVFEMFHKSKRPIITVEEMVLNFINKKTMEELPII